MRRSAQLPKILMERGPYRRYLPKTARSLFIADSHEQEEVTKKEFVAEGIYLKFIGVVGT